MSRNLPLMSAAEVAKHNTQDDCWVTLFNRKVYDISSFFHEHPGGADVMLPYAGKDVTAIMADAVSHVHSESAYEMLDEDMLVGYLATSHEEKNLLNNKNGTTVEVKLGNAESDEEFDMYEFHDKLPDDYRKLWVKTDFAEDTKKHKFLDLNKPLLKQVWNGNFSKEFYLDQIHRPRHYGKGSAPLFGNFLEPLTKTPWYVIPMLWLPVNLMFFMTGFKNVHPVTHFSLWALGIFVWTLIEYFLHRCIFHADRFLPPYGPAFTIHFLLHGVHHYLPMDEYRLVVPPALLTILAFPFYKLIFAIFPFYQACSAFSGGTLGYILYDITHFVLHHTKLPSFYQELKTYHLEHHYKNYDLGFGVSSRFWDVVFGTEITETYKPKKA